MLRHSDLVTGQTPRALYITARAARRSRVPYSARALGCLLWPHAAAIYLLRWKCDVLDFEIRALFLDHGLL